MSRLKNHEINIKYIVDHKQNSAVSVLRTEVKLNRQKNNFFFNFNVFSVIKRVNLKVLSVANKSGYVSTSPTSYHMQHQEKIITETDFTVECSKFNTLNFAIKTTYSLKKTYQILQRSDLLRVSQFLIMKKPHPLYCE